MDFLRNLGSYFHSKPPVDEPDYKSASAVWKEYVHLGGKDQGHQVKIVKNMDKDFSLRYVPKFPSRPSREAVALCREIANVITQKNYNNLSINELSIHIQAIQSFMSVHYMGESRGEFAQTLEKLNARKERLVMEKDLSLPLSQKILNTPVAWKCFEGKEMTPKEALDHWEHCRSESTADFLWDFEKEFAQHFPTTSPTSSSSGGISDE